MGLGSGPTLDSALFLKEPRYSYNWYKPSLEDDVWLADSAVVDVSFFKNVVIWKWIGDKLSFNARFMIIEPADHRRWGGSYSETKKQSLSCILKAGTHRPNRWTSEAFGETRMRSETNMFGVFSCVWSFRSRLDAVCSDSACEVWGGGPSDVWAIEFSDWRCANESARCVEGQNTVCVLVFHRLRSVIPCCYV